MNKILSTKPNNLVIIGILLLMVSVILFGMFFLRGKKTVSSSFSETHTDSALICSRTNLNYEFLEYNNSLKEETNIYLIFNQNNQARTISLKETLYYNSYDNIKHSEAWNHGAMNTSFAKSGLGADALGAAYSMQDDKLIISLYTNTEGLKLSALKYFLINDHADFSKDALENHYTELGFTCVNQE